MVNGAGGQQLPIALHCAAKELKWVQSILLYFLVTSKFGFKNNVIKHSPVLLFRENSATLGLKGVNYMVILTAVPMANSKLPCKVHAGCKAAAHCKTLAGSQAQAHCKVKAHFKIQAYLSKFAAKSYIDHLNQGFPQHFVTWNFASTVSV